MSTNNVSFRLWRSEAGQSSRSLLFLLCLAAVMFMIIIAPVMKREQQESRKTKQATSSAIFASIKNVGEQDPIGVTGLSGILDFSDTNTVNAYWTEEYFGYRWVVRGFSTGKWSTVVYYPNIVEVEPVMFPKSGPRALYQEVEMTIPIRISMKLPDGSYVWQPVHLQTIDPKHTLFVAVSTNHLQHLRNRMLRKG